MFMIHDKKKVYVQSLKMKEGNTEGFLSRVNNVILVEGLMHNILSISQLRNIGYDIILNQNFC